MLHPVYGLEMNMGGPHTGTIIFTCIINIFFTNSQNQTFDHGSAVASRAAKAGTDWQPQA